MDTSHLENIAEDHVSHVLQKHGFFVAKPKFDLKGTDLLAFIQMGDGVKFARLQSKGRNIDTGSQIKVPAAYVTDGFVVFLYLQDHHKSDWLYCFFASEIRHWTQTPDGEYQLSIPASSHEQKFAAAKVTSERLAALRYLIEQAEVHGEFQHLSVISGNLQLDDLVFSGGFGSQPSGA